MTEAIRLTCRCGSTFSMECSSYAAGGRRDDKGRMYIAEVRADAWMAAHAGCLTLLDWSAVSLKDRKQRFIAREDDKVTASPPGSA